MGAVTGVGLAVPALRPRHRLDDRQVEDPGEVPVALVLTGHGHDRAGAVGAQHVVGQEDRHRPTGERVAGERARRATALGQLALGRQAVDLGGRTGDLDEALDVATVLVGDDARHQRVLGCEHAERHAVAGVGTGSEDLERDRLAVVEHGRALRVDDLHRELGAFGPADPVALLGDDPLGPVDDVEVVEQLLGVVGDAEVPLLEVALLDQGTGALGGAVGQHLLVGEHGLVDRVPVDRRGLAVGQAGLQETQEDPLRPADVVRVVALDLSPPVVHAADPGDRAAQHLDALVGEPAGVATGLDRRVLRGQAEAVETHRRQDGVALHGAVARQQVAEGVVAHVTHVRRARRVGVHAQHVVPVARVVVVDLVGALVTPVRLPTRLDQLRVVGRRHLVGHPWIVPTPAGPPRTGNALPRRFHSPTARRYGVHPCGAVAQLARALPWHGRGREFDSHRLHNGVARTQQGVRPLAGPLLVPPVADRISRPGAAA